MPYRANFDAACGANASAFGPNAALYLHFTSVFFYSFLAKCPDISPADIAPPGAGLDFSLAPPSPPKPTSHSQTPPLFAVSAVGFYRESAEQYYIYKRRRDHNIRHPECILSDRQEPGIQQCV